MPAPPKATSRSSRRRRASARSTRAKGFKDELAAKYPGLKIVADKAANGKAAASGLSIVNELIRRQCEPARRVRLDFVLTEAAGQSIADNKKAHAIKLIGVDSDEKLVGS